MIKQFRLLGLALMAVFALGAIASASASAENPLFLPTPTATEPLTFTSETDEKTEPQLAGTAGIIKCTKATNKGEFTSATLGNVEIDFTGCTSGAAKCKSLGDVAGTILLTKKGTLIHLVTVLLGGVLGLGLMILLDELVHVECGILLILILGDVIGQFDNVKELEKTKHLTLLFEPVKEGSTEQSIKTCDQPVALCEKEGKKVEFELKADFGKGEEKVSQKADVLFLFPKEVEVHF